ncbi:MAG TPA: glycosyltransferase family 4 protein, partial [Solirubrobacteraceae bacterium]
MPSPGLAIAQVSPVAWEVRSEVGEYVARVSEELCSRGHRVLIVAPSQSPERVRDSRRAIRSEADALLDSAQGKPVVLGVGEVLPFSPTRRRAASLPVDVARTIEEALTGISLDIVHVHEPFAPSASSVALRHSRALNVGSFHAPTERVLSTQLARPLSRLLFERLDTRIASFSATRQLIQQYFPGEYRVILPGAPVPSGAEPTGPPRILFIASEERAALRIFLRALRLLPSDSEWSATVLSQRPLATPATLGRGLRDRVEFVDDTTTSEEDALGQADAIVLASEGVRTIPWTLVRALAAGVTPVVSRLAPYEELLVDGRYGYVFVPGDVQTLAAHLERVISDPQMRERRHARVEQQGARFAFSRVADDLEAVYRSLVSRRHDDRGN